MNTNSTINTNIKSLLYFPQLTDRKQGRIFTKHYCNLSLILHPNHISLLSFLVYHSGADNVVKYSTTLLKMYQSAVVKSSNYYKIVNPYITASVPNARKSFQWLVEHGILIPAGKGEFLINPSITYNRLYVKKHFYRQWCNSYCNGESIKHLTKTYIDHVAESFKQRKNNL